MDKMIVAVFDNEENGYEGVRALEDLHENNTITLYSKAVIKKNEDGRITHIEESERGPLGTAVGLLTGTMIGVLGGPVGVAVGAYVGLIGGGLFDLAKIGVSDDFIAEVGEYLLPGKVAVIAEVDEEWVTPVDSRMEAAGAIVFRRVRGDIVDTQIERDAAAFQAEIAELNDEIKSANAEAKAKLQVKLDTAKAKLHATQEKAKAALEETKREMDAKVDSLKEQIKSANAEAKARLEKRIEDIKADYNRRIEKLKKSWEITQEAAANWRYAQTHIS